MSDTGDTKTPRTDFPCSVCGGDMRYLPKMGQMECVHCGHVETIAPPAQSWKLAEADLDRAIAANLPPENYEISRVIQCTNCGSEIEFAPDDQSRECAYCASPVVLEPQENRHIRAQAILPFGFGEKEARVYLEKWISGRWFAPSALRLHARQKHHFSGIYTPFWTYDAQTKTKYSGQRGDDHYVTVGHGQNKRRERRTSWRRVSGQVARFFDDVLVLASQALPRQYIDEIMPWDLNALEPYNPQFLAGFRAQMYSLDIEEGWKEAQILMQRRIERDIKFDIGGDHQRIGQMETHVWDTTFKHILLPVYSLAYKFRGKTYRCVINGQTGRVSGERPYSIIKIAAVVLLIALLVAGVFYLDQAGYLGDSFYIE